MRLWKLPAAMAAAFICVMGNAAQAAPITTLTLEGQIFFVGDLEPGNGFDIGTAFSLSVLYDEAAPNAQLGVYDIISSAVVFSSGQTVSGLASQSPLLIENDSTQTGTILPADRITLGGTADDPDVFSFVASLRDESASIFNTEDLSQIFPVFEAGDLSVFDFPTFFIDIAEGSNQFGECPIGLGVCTAFGSITSISATQTGVVAPIPLPATLPLMAAGFGVLGLAWYRRRRSV